MITSVTGVLVAAGPLQAVVEVQGLGYEVNIPVTTAEKLPAAGARLTLHTHVAYREDAQVLYGFATVAERDFFRLMITHVTGVGPKLALTIMSKLSLPLLESAIRNGDVPLLSQCPGIGRKTAERLVIELRAKVGGTGAAEAGDPAVPAAGESAYRDAIAALVALGYKPADADQAVRKAGRELGASASTEALIKRSLA